MELILDIVKSGKIRPKYKSLRFNQCDGVIGRGDKVTYQLQDSNNYISTNHVFIEFKYGKYYLRDESTNGTYLKHPYKKLTRGISHLIGVSEVYVIGDHEIQARFNDSEYTDEYIVNTSNIIQTPEQPTTINELIPDDFLLDDDSLLKGSVEKEDNSEDILDLLDDTKNIDFEDSFLHTNDINHLQTEDELIYQNIDLPRYSTKTHLTHQNKPSVNITDNDLIDSIKIIEKSLNIEVINLPKNKRDDLMHMLSDIVRISLDELNNTLQIQDKIKQDLKITPTNLSKAQNNPVKLGQSATQLLQDQQMSQKLGMLDLPNAIKKSFQEINSHNIALHGSAKNIMKTTVNQFIPKQLEHKIESNGYIRYKFLPKTLMMWQGYCSMFDRISKDGSFENELIQKEFAKEYENISFSLNLNNQNK
ncbi:type VI secretion system-associated FHA domain protein TagH [Arcobacter sp. FWKO B]|uniref:type VI secretion system-associated FHA domain protein TagH n=1 Tax=Arcobacter sp. FWKO B TaxID=2593672 RepID=UPI0018A3FF35|nr:type VI secretion system-associated FHA domain protein TagH [Arcobacter sp. FWKO B]QOG13210.1 type VI secretion system-associated FHA domain protein TagH [Arcobacter sp. FWKO B]